jgi:hypothetical protein
MPLGVSVYVKALSVASDAVTEEWVQRTGNRWIACCDVDDTPAYDAAGATPEEAFARLAEVLMEALLKKEAS